MLRESSRSKRDWALSTMEKHQNTMAQKERKEILWFYRMVLITMENGIKSLELEMAEATRSGLMGHSTKDIGRATKPTAEDV